MEDQFENFDQEAEATEDEEQEECDAEDEYDETLNDE
jgi:hypothetical protein